MLPFAPAKPLPIVKTHCAINVLVKPSSIHELNSVSTDRIGSIRSHRKWTEVGKLRGKEGKLVTHERKNMDTPIGPRSANTPVLGNMIIPSRNPDELERLHSKNGALT